jgi:hypothetical protein
MLPDRSTGVNRLYAVFPNTVRRRDWRRSGLVEALVQAGAQLVRFEVGVGAALAGHDDAGRGHPCEARYADQLPRHPHESVGYAPCPTPLS